jgi:hypothetical protein
VQTRQGRQGDEVQALDRGLRALRFEPEVPRGENERVSVDWLARRLAERVTERRGLCRELMQSRDETKRRQRVMRDRALDTTLGMVRNSKCGRSGKHRCL